MCRRQPLDVTEAGGRRVLIAAEQQEISDGEVVQRVRDGVVTSKRFNGAAHEQPMTDAGVIERFHAHVVPRAEKTTLRAVPDGERKIAEQTLDAMRAPEGVRAEKQLHIRQL